MLSRDCRAVQYVSRLKWMPGTIFACLLFLKRSMIDVSRGGAGTAATAWLPVKPGALDKARMMAGLVWSLDHTSRQPSPLGPSEKNGWAASTTCTLRCHALVLHPFVMSHDLGHELVEEAVLHVAEEKAALAAL